jgi:hypothetical protein
MKLICSLLCALAALLFARPAAGRRRASAFYDVYNEAPPAWDLARDGVVADIANAAPIDDQSDWFQVAPYGQHPNRVGLQVFTKAEADAMVASFNSLAAKVGRLFRGAPVYAGHPDVDPGRWPDSRRLGKITTLEARNDGLYAQAAWNSLGADNNAQGFYVFPSPRWLCEKAGKSLRPVELISVGLTNTPNISSSAPVTANDAADGAPGEGKPEEPAAAPTAEALDAVNASLFAMTAERDAAAAQVTALTAERDGLVTQIEALNASVTTTRDTLTAQITAANDALAAERGLHRDALLDHAVESGRLTPADRPAMVALFNSSWDEATAALKKRPPVYNTASLNLPRDRAPLATAHERQVAMQEAVNAVMAARGVDYTTAWGLAKKDKATAHLFATAVNA